MELTTRDFESAIDRCAVDQDDKMVMNGEAARLNRKP